MELDNIDFKILHLLSENSRMQWKDLGERIHMTGQAVGNRIKKLEDSGVIKTYSIMVDEMKLGLSFTAFVIIYMKTSNHDPFLHFMKERKEIVEAHRVSGEGCYHMKVKDTAQEEFNLYLNEILKFANYALYLAIQERKQQTLLDTI